MAMYGVKNGVCFWYMFSSHLWFFYMFLHHSNHNNRPRSKLLAHFYPQPFVSPAWPRCGRSGIRWLPGNLGKTSWTCPGNHCFRWYFLGQFLEFWEKTWRFPVNIQFHEFSARLPQDCGMQPGKTFLDVDGSFSGRQEVQGFAIPLQLLGFFKDYQSDLATLQACGF